MVKGVVTRDCKKVSVDGLRVISDDPNTIAVESVGSDELITKNIEIFDKSLEESNQEVEKITKNNEYSLLKMIKKKAKSLWVIALAISTPLSVWITIQTGLLDTLSPYIAFVKNYFQMGE